MPLVHRIAVSGHFLGDVLLATDSEIPSDCIAVHPPEGLQWPQWDGAAWGDAGHPFTVDPATGAPILPE